MIFYLKPILILLWLILVPFLIGTIPYKLSRQNNLIDLQYIQGWLIMMGIFQLLAIPMIFLRLNFHVLVITWSLIIMFLGIVSFMLNRKIYNYVILEIKENLKRMPLNMIFAIILILVQTLLIIFLEHVDDDDAFYVGTAVTTLQDNSMYEIDPYTGNLYSIFPKRYVLSSFPVFIALIGKLTMLHPTIIAHTVLPFFLIPLTYMVYYMIGKELFNNDIIKTSNFLMLISVLNLWGNYSEYTTSSFLLFRIWQGKAILANILLPMVLYCIIRLSKEGKQWYNWTLVITLVLAGSMASSMGIFFMPMSLGIYGLVYLFVKKDFLMYFKILLCCIPSVIYGVIYVFAL